MLVGAKRISGQIAGESGQNCLLIMWIGLWSGQTGIIIVLLYELLRVSWLTVIIILIVE